MQVERCFRGAGQKEKRLLGFDKSFLLDYSHRGGDEASKGLGIQWCSYEN
jgi:hypothetical protein